MPEKYVETGLSKKNKSDEDEELLANIKALSLNEETKE